MKVERPRRLPADDAQQQDLLDDLATMLRVTWWAICVAVATALVLHQARLLAMNVPAVLALAAATHASSWGAVHLGARVERPLRVYLAAHLLNAALLTATIHYVGGIGFLPAPMLYGLIVANGGIAGGGGALLLAAACTAAYGLLVVAELHGVWPPLVEAGVPRLALDPRVWSAVVVAAGVALHLSAAYAGRLAGLLRARRREVDAYREAVEREARDRRRADDAAQRAESDRHEQSVRYRTFAYIMTHDLKNPINAIYLTADLLLSRHAGELTPRVAAAVDRMRSMAEGAEAKIFDLMNLYRIVGTPEPDAWVDFNELVDDAVGELRDQIEAKQIRVDVTRLPVVWGQYEKLGHVVSNLLSNAVKFVPAGTGQVAVRGGPDGGGVTLVIEDNGIGIPAPYHGRIFELFACVPDAERRVDGVAPTGTGVGLALVKRIVELHQGHVSVASTVDAGSRFAVWLPAGREARLHG